MTSTSPNDAPLQNIEPEPTQPTNSPENLILSTIPTKPLEWLWPARLPLGQLTLLDGTPGSGTSLFTLTLAACISNGSPFPDGTPCPQSNVILIAPYDSPADTIRPRLEAAGADLSHILLFSLSKDSSASATARDLDRLSTTIKNLQARLVIIDPASAIPGLRRHLSTLAQIAHQTGCTILLTRSLRQSPADPLHTSAPASPFLDAARSRILLTPDPTDERKHLLLTTKHPLCTPSDILSYEIIASAQGIPTIHWLGTSDASKLNRLATGPIRSLHRQAILRFLHNTPTAHTIKDILVATSYDYEAGRKMLLRMQQAGELISPARGLYTIPGHPCLAQPIAPAEPLPFHLEKLLSSRVSTVSNVPELNNNATQNPSPTTILPTPNTPISENSIVDNPSPTPVPNVPANPTVENNTNGLPPPSPLPFAHDASIISPTTHVPNVPDLQTQ